MPGIATAITTLCQYLLQPGDAVMVDDPGWFWLIGCLQQQGLRVLGVQRDEQGPNIAQMQHWLHTERPRLYITNSVLHNPTSYLLHPARAHQVLQLLNEYDAYLLEDDVYGALAPDVAAVRYATLDQMQRVFYVGGVSKILGGSWRVALMCCPAEHTDGLLRQKMLGHMVCPEINERMVYQLLQSGHYRHHVTQLQQRLAAAHQRIRHRLHDIGLTYPPHTHPGLFIWLDTGVDTTEMALAASEDQWLLAPGHLFSPQRQNSTHTRINVSRCPEPFLEWLGTYIRRQH